MKKFLTTNISFKILSVVFAVVLWLIVLNIDDPNTTKTINNIDITLKNEEALMNLDKSYEIIEGDTASVSVTGPRSIVDKLSASDFVATVDFTELSQTNAIPIKVELKKQSSKDRVAITIKTTTMKIAVEDIKTEEFEVEIKNTGYLKKGYIIFQNDIKNSTVKVSAPASVMQKISGVVAVVEGNGESKDFTKLVQLECIDEYGRTINHKTNKIKLNVEKTSIDTIVMYTKTLKIVDDINSVLGENYFASEKKFSEKEVTVAGKRSVLKDIDSLCIPNSLFKLEDGKKDYKIVCNITNILPEGVYLYDEVSSVTLSVHVDYDAIRTIKLDTKKLALTNIPTGYVASIETKGKLEYILHGKDDLLNNYEEPDSYNVSLEGLGEGVHTVKITVNVEDGISLENDIYVQVKLEKVEKETTTVEETTIDVVSKETTKKSENETTTEDDEETTTEQEETNESEE